MVKFSNEPNIGNIERYFPRIYLDGSRPLAGEPELLDEKTDAWLKFAIAFSPATAPVPTVGYPSDDYLRNVIAKHIRKKGPPKKTPIQRATLCDVAVRLRLVSREEADLVPTKRKLGFKSWFDVVNSAPRRDEPVSPDSLEWLEADDLQKLLEDHTGELAPMNQSRAYLMKMVLHLNLISATQGLVMRPTYLKMDELDKRWDERDKSLLGAIRKRRPNGRKEMLDALASIGLVTASEANAKVQREDKAMKADNAKGLKRVSRGITFATIFRGLPGADALKATVEDICIKTSKLIHQRGFLIWLVLHRLITEDLPFPKLRGNSLSNFIRRCFVVGTPGSISDKKDPVILETLKRNARLFPTLERPPNADNVVTHAARTYRTAFERHFLNFDTVEARVKRVASSMLFDPYVRASNAAEEDADDPRLPEKVYVGHEPLNNVLSALKDPSFDRRVMHPRQVEVLEKIQAMFGLSGSATQPAQKLEPRWLAQNMEKSVRFCLAAAHHMDGVSEATQALKKRLPDRSAGQSKLKLRRGFSKGIRFVPLNAADRRFVTLDATTLVELMGTYKPIARDRAEEAEEDGDDEDNMQDPLAVEIVQSTFAENIERAFGKKYVATDGFAFTGTIVTDTSSMAYCQFDRVLRPGEEKTKKKKIERELGAPVLPPPPPPPPKVKLKKVPDLVFLVDPGRVNIVTMTVLWKGKPMMVSNGKGGQKPLIFTFTSRQYYTMTGVIKARCARTRRLRNDPILKGLYEGLSSASLRTGNVDKIKAYMETMVEKEAAAKKHWTERLSKKASSARRRSRVAKDKVLIKFFLGVKRKVFAMTGLLEAVVVWGSAKFAPGSIGCPAVPTSKAFVVASRVPGWDVIPSSEFRTSKTSCFAPHADNIAPRFRGVVSVVERCMPTKLGAKLRAGYVVGLIKQLRCLTTASDCYDATAMARSSGRCPRSRSGPMSSGRLTVTPTRAQLSRRRKESSERS